MIPTTTSRTLNMSQSAPLKITVLTWNIENMKTSKFTLKSYIDYAVPDLILLNETQIFQFEVEQALEFLHGEYKHTLNSDDLLDPELPFIKNRSNGGTMILWRKDWNQSISIIPTDSSSFVAIALSIPGTQPSIHIAMYLPTAGKESEFVEEITKLKAFVEGIADSHPDHFVFIRGDSNVNPNNNSRFTIFDDFKKILNLHQVQIGHRTYHHFMGDGLFDSEIDVILHSKTKFINEKIENIFCKSEDPNINSHHDIIISSFQLNHLPTTQVPLHHVPTVPNLRKKIIWSDVQDEYQNILDDNLENLRSRWLQPSSKTAVSLLLQLTSEILCSAAESTNEYIELSNIKTKPAHKIPPRIKKSMNRIKNKLAIVKKISTPDTDLKDVSIAVENLKEANYHHRKLIRQFISKQRHREDKRMFSLLSSSSNPIYRKIKSNKKSSAEKIPFLKVGNETFFGENVKYGFFKSISKLKTKTNVAMKEMNFIDDYENIIKICQRKRDIPNISVEKSTKLLKRMKSSVTDFYNLTTEHFLKAGNAGIEHFNFLLNCIIDEVNNATIEELNSCYALLLHKAHGKSRTSDKAYRTITTCPLVSKALDLYIKDIYKDKWSLEQAETQYQGDGSCHDLAAILLTEVIQHSLFTLHEPAYLLFLDAMSAFDTVAPEVLIRKLYLSGMDGQSIVLINHRLTNRLSFIDWNRTILGPIRDEQGLEQGGPNSSEYYKIYSNENLNTAQKSSQGIKLSKSQVISAIGLADDTVITANKLSKLANILFITNKYCEKYGVTLSAEKTRMLRITNCDPVYLETYNPILIDGKQITFCESAEHVGVIRSQQGNGQHILNRINSHVKALRATLSAGSAQNSRASPLVGLRLEKVYGSPVLLSGIPTLVLSQAEIATIAKHQTVTHQNLQKLLPKTPRSFVHFLGGILPTEAVIHQQMLSRFGMVARLPRDPLNIHARNILTAAKSSSKSWFIQIRNICLQYHLPHPLRILENPPCKEKYKKLIKSKITDYWELKLRGEASLLSSLVYFKPEYMSLVKPHPIWSTAGNNPYEISKAIQQARFLSGRYRSQSLVSHWSPNSDGSCLSPTCKEEKETIEHILLDCQAYNDCKSRLYSLWLSAKILEVHDLLLEALTSDRAYLLQFILDCSVLPQVIRATQVKNGDLILRELFYYTRTWCFSIHKARMKMLGRWNFS